MKIPHYDEHGQPLGQVEVELPDRAKPRPVHVQLPDNRLNHKQPTRPVLSALEPIVDVKMHELPEPSTGHLAVILTIAVGCLLAFGALMWVVLSK
jgi:hypothetical protein